MTDKTFQSSYDVKQVFYGSKVDIIIPFHKQEAKVSKLVESILTHTNRANSYRIILVDDYSKNDWGDLWKQVPGVSIIRNEKQLGFGGSLYQGFINSDAPWVVFMHSDCLIETPNWMFEMGKSLVNFRDNKSKVKMISARTDNPGDGYDIRLKAEKTEASEDVIAEGTLPLYCVMCHRELFERIGGFIKKYPYAFYEDEELTFRMKKYGYTQAICGNSWVKHEGGATITPLLKNKKIRNIIETNRELCMKDMGLIRP
jgi:glycosyltransferase involved in cell wall biosynthesis